MKHGHLNVKGLLILKGDDPVL